MYPKLLTIPIPEFLQGLLPAYFTIHSYGLMIALGVIVAFYMILNLSSLNLKIDKNEIYEHYFMKQIYFTKNWLIDDLNDLIKYVGGWSGQNSLKLYAYWMSICSEQKHKNVFKTIEKFIKSDEDSININHL